MLNQFLQSLPSLLSCRPVFIVVVPVLGGIGWWWTPSGVSTVERNIEH
jgi:hypothetical protein